MDRSEAYNGICDTDPDCDKHRVFFAFSDEQLRQGMEKFGYKGTSELVRGIGGVLGSKEGVRAFLGEYEKRAERVRNECDPQKVYDYEYGNHECDYVGDDEEAIRIAADIFGKETAGKVNRRNACIDISEICDRRNTAKQPQETAMNNLPTREQFEKLSAGTLAFANVDAKELAERGAYCALLVSAVDKSYFRIDPKDENEQPIPSFKDDEWFAIIDLEAKKMLGWDYPVQWKAHCLKVCDGGRYVVYDKEGKALAGYYDYVPSFFPDFADGDSHWGDYMILNVATDGTITNRDKTLCSFESRKKKTTNAKAFIDRIKKIQKHSKKYGQETTAITI